MITLNYLAVIGAAVASMIVGFVWYGPLFGKLWMKLSGITTADMESGKKKGMAKTYLLAFVGSLVMSYVLANFLVFASAYFNEVSVKGGLITGFWSWLGFVAPVTLGSVLWEGKSWKLWFLNNAYYLVTLSVMGLILAAWQ